MCSTRHVDCLQGHEASAYPIFAPLRSHGYMLRTKHMMPVLAHATVIVTCNLHSWRHVSADTVMCMQIVMLCREGCPTYIMRACSSHHSSMHKLRADLSVRRNCLRSALGVFACLARVGLLNVGLTWVKFLPRSVVALRRHRCRPPGSRSCTPRHRPGERGLAARAFLASTHLS